ncbi:tetratricopeptide repeat protein [Rapidithrix thailandica]|uniref:Tetratricopeptide repeat protein n=1 Tax=Rapidithrix thailandica TaxID=413964 RepID=A0AAW9SEN0_9BACT
MNRMHRLFLVLLLIGFAHAKSWGQNTLTEVHEDLHYRNGLEFFEKKKYAASQHSFERYLALGYTDDRAIQAEYYVGLCALKLRNPNFESLILAFVEKHPTHHLTREAYIDLGSYYFDKGQFLPAQEYLEKARIENLVTERDIEASYKLAYAYFELGKNREAKKIFKVIKGGSHPYAAHSSYYYGYLSYLDGEYEEAIQNLERASQHPDLRKDSYVLLPSIYYKQRKFDKVLAYAQEIEARGEEVPLELQLLVGDVYYEQEDYTQAAKYLEEYMQSNQAEVDRGEYYRVGYANFKTGNKHAAAKYLSNAADGQDTLAQVAAYHLGICYLSLDEKEMAVAAFDKVRRLEHDEQIQELGAYYFAKASFDVADFRTAVEAGKFYIDNFPDGTHTQEVFSIASEAFLHSGDYEEALRYIANVKSDDPRFQAAYQQIAFNKAVQDYNDENYGEAVRTLKMSLRYPMNQEVTHATNYWLGEIYSFGNKYDTALVYFQRVPTSSSYNQKAQYGRGYALYNTKKYEQALYQFSNYIQHSSDADKNKKVDALMRLGDCYYVTKNYENALRVYQVALDNGSVDMDYIHFQMGMTYKQYGRFNDANRSFDKVIYEHNQSKYREEAYYQKAMVFFENARRAEAVSWFSKILAEYPNSVLVPYVYSKRALSYKLQNNLAQAANDYKKIIDLYPRHKVAESAIQSLQEINSQGYAVQDLALYIQKFTRANPESDVTLLAAYEAAKRPFDNGNYREAVVSLGNFIKSTQRSRYTGDAYYYLGYSYNLLDNQNLALKSYKEVEGSLRVRAVREIAELEFQNENYSEALQYYLELQKLADKKRYTEQALSGLVRCYFELNDFEATNIYAKQILDEKISRYQTLALLYLGKVQLAQGAYIQAVKQFQLTTTSAEDKYAAEAQYLIGMALRKQGNLEESTQALIDVRNKFDSYPEWIYEAYLLIAENYIDLGNKFQAKATLNSIVENSKDPVYQERAKNRLAELEI